jgi:site-specific DNA-methyltransferase (adenine-specific)
MVEVAPRVAAGLSGRMITHSNTAHPAQDARISPWLDRVHTGDCLALLPDLPDASVDMVFADLPYGVSQNKWDTPIALPELWAELKRVAKPDAAIVMTATQPFTSTLVASNLRDFKYERIWVKTIGSNQQNIRIQPLRKHESILVFYANQPTYNPQMTDGDPYTIRRKASGFAGGYGKQRDHISVNDGRRHPTSVLEIPNPRMPRGHATGKPVALLEDLIRTFTNPGDIVLDPVIGGGTTALAALGLERHYIGMEMDPNCADLARSRIQNSPARTSDEDADAA